MPQTPEKRNLTGIDNPGENSNLTKQRRLESNQIVSLYEPDTLENAWHKLMKEHHGFVGTDNAGEEASNRSERAKLILDQLQQFSTEDKHHLKTLLSLDSKMLKRFIITDAYADAHPQLRLMQGFHDYIKKMLEWK